MHGIIFGLHQCNIEKKEVQERILKKRVNFPISALKSPYISSFSLAVDDSGA